MKRWIRTALYLAVFVPVLASGGERWLPVRDMSLMIEAGSVLDFSALVPSGPVAQRIVVSKDGFLALEHDQSKPLRMLMAALGLGAHSGGFPDHTQADLYARQIRAHGYTMARLDFVEESLMHTRREDFDFDPEQLDRLFYLLAALKREGVYYVLNGLSLENAAYGNIAERWTNERNMKLGVYIDSERQQHWKELMRRLFAVVNPYTAIRLLDDPALAGIIMVNEGGLPFVSRNGVSDALRPAFALWLKNKYGNREGLVKAWVAELHSDERLDDSSIRFPKPTDWTSKRMADTQRFFVDLERETADWMVRYLRQLGYKGLLTAYDNWLSPAAHASRAQFEWVDMHAYFAEPSKGIQQGSVMRQGSMLADHARYIGELAASRHVGKAFSVSEFGQVFWNRYRRESGLAVAAYAAFQGWDIICQHTNAIRLSYAGAGKRERGVGPFDVGLDPVARAGETLAALLFARGDVTKARHALGVKLEPWFVFDESAHLGAIPLDIRRLSLLASIGLDWQGQAAHRYDAQVVLGGGLLVGNKGIGQREKGNAFSVAGDFVRKHGGRLGYQLEKKASAETRWRQRVEAMRDAGIIGTDNKTDADAGVYQSDTGQITLDSQRRRLTVMTPRTEAVVFDAPERIPLDALSVESADGPALVSASAMDGQPLRESRRILVILATDARNSGMHFSDAAETSLQNLGEMPVLIKAASITLRLKNQNPGKLAVYSTNLRGQRVDAIPVTHDGEAILFTLDTAALSHGPTKYFEIAGVDEHK